MEGRAAIGIAAAEHTTIAKDIEKAGAAIQYTGQVLPHAGETFCL